MYAAIESGLLSGVDLVPIRTEVSITPGLPSFSIVGLPTNAVTEARARVKAALTKQGFEFPNRRIVVNLAPADIKKETALFDLPIALSIVCAQHPALQPKLANIICFGELSLDGRLTPSGLSLPLTLAAKRRGYRHVYMNAIDAPLASHIDNIEVRGFASLRAIMEHVTGASHCPPAHPARLESCRDQSLDFNQVLGLKWVKRAMKIAATGQHNIRLSGPPGCGKSMLGHRLHTILPDLCAEKALEVASLDGHRIGGLGSGYLNIEAPSRSPHYSVTTAGLIGGGANPKPGEVSLAHHGVLFLDEFLEFRKHQLEALRTPIEARKVLISRAERVVCYPTDFILVAAHNPCPCGYHGTGTGSCCCTPRELRSYRSKLSGPLNDRFDMLVQVKSGQGCNPITQKTDGQSSSDIREDISAARAFAASETVVNQRQLSPGAVSVLGQINAAGSYSFRRRTRLVNVARTIANLDRSVVVDRQHVQEAYYYSPSMTPQQSSPAWKKV